MSSPFKKIFFLAVCLFVFTGCRIAFEADSVVREDGSIERTTLYKAQDDSDKAEILDLYELPSGGVWGESSMRIAADGEGEESRNKMVPSYSAQQVVPTGDAPGTDFRRFTKLKDKAAFNQFSVEVKDWWFVKWFDYEEKFQDVHDRDNLAEILAGVVEKGLVEFRAQLSVGISDQEQLDAIINELRLKYKPIVVKWAKVFSGYDWASRGNNIAGQLGEEFDVASQELEKEFNARATVDFLAARFPGLDTPENHALIIQAFENTEAVITDEMEFLEEAVFGVHGFALFQNYDFKIRVRMPGAILSTNADKQEEGVLTWEFEQLGLDRTLSAKSRRIYFERIASVSAAFFVVVLVIILALLRRKRKLK